MPHEKTKEAGFAEPYNKNKRFAAKFFGVSVYAVDRWVIDRTIPHIKLNNRLVRFRLSDLRRHAEERRVA